MTARPSEDDLFALLTRNARIPLEEVKRHPHGATFPSDIVVSPKEPDWEHRLDVGNEQMMSDLADVASEVSLSHPAPADSALRFRLIYRRMHTRCNSGGHTMPALVAEDPTNPAFMHPEDMSVLGLSDGDIVEVRSARARILGVVMADATLRRGLVSMAHAWGDAPDRDQDVRTVGGPPARLADLRDSFDPYSGQPIMSNIAVTVQRKQG